MWTSEVDVCDLGAERQQRVHAGDRLPRGVIFAEVAETETVDVGSDIRSAC
jgi:hypothetical protein